MSASRYTFLNRHCLHEPPGMDLGSTRASWGGGLVVSTVSLPSACRSWTSFSCCSGTPFAYYSRTPSPPFDCSSARVLRGGALVLRGGATRAPSSSNHSDIGALCVQVVWSPPSDMSPDLRGAAPTIFLFF